MIKTSIFTALTYIIYTLSTGEIAEHSESISISGNNYYYDNGSFLSVNTNELQVGTTTQFVAWVWGETNGCRVRVGGTQNTNQLTDIQPVTFQTLKPAELKQVENNFMLICSNFTGNVTQKLTFADVYTRLKELKQHDKTRYEDVRDDLIFIDAWGKKYNKDWWDTCVWHTEL